MKKLVAATAVIALMAAPAFAKHKKHHHPMTTGMSKGSNGLVNGTPTGNNMNAGHADVPNGSPAAPSANKAGSGATNAGQGGR